MQTEVRYTHYVTVPECENPIHYAWIIQAYITEGWARKLSDEGVNFYHTGIDAGKDTDRRFRVYIVTDTNISQWLEGLEYPPHLEEETD